MTNTDSTEDSRHSGTPSLSPSDESSSTSSTTNQHSKADKEVVGAAAITGAVAGMAIGGPALAIASGAGIAYAASNDEGCLGEATRSTGKRVLKLKDKVGEWEDEHHYVENAAESAKQKVAKMDEKNHFLETSSQVIQKNIEKAQEYEEDHHILEKIRESVEDTYSNIAQWSQEHQVVERSKNMAAQGTAFAMSKIRECVRPNTAIDAQVERDYVKVEKV